MKIGILTYQRPHNYGALLQAYSLKKYLCRKGFNVEIIDYWPTYHSDIYKLFFNFSKLRYLSKIKKVIFTIIDFYRIFKRRKGYSNFCQKYLDLARSPKCLDKKSLNELYFDIIVYGSDQIWRKHKIPICEGFDDVYFGEHIPSKRKITYAASMGIIDLNKQDEQFIKKKLENFDSMSVRESELRNVILKLTKKNVQLVLDPVFLLSKNEWRNIISPKVKNQKYVFLYNLLGDNEAVILTNKIATFFKCNVIEIPGTNVNTNLWGKRYNQTASPFEFLSLISNASFIVTSSFHGIAFSLIFEKQFYAIGFNKNSDRIKTLLETLGIGHRYLKNSDELDNKDIIDYIKVNTHLGKQIENSSNYLNQALAYNCELPSRKTV